MTFRNDRVLRNTMFDLTTVVSLSKTKRFDKYPKINDGLIFIFKLLNSSYMQS